VEVRLGQQRRSRRLLVCGQVLRGQPASALVAEQIRRWTARHRVAVRDRVDLFLPRVR
jgi:hypothetical protein